MCQLLTRCYTTRETVQKGNLSRPVDTHVCLVGHVQVLDVFDELLLQVGRYQRVVSDE